MIDAGNPTVSAPDIPSVRRGQSGPRYGSAEWRVLLLREVAVQARCSTPRRILWIETDAWAPVCF